MIQLSIILPTYNEKKNLPLIIDKIENTLPTGIYEVIVVDDNSPDKTYETSQNIGRNKPWVHTIRRLEERGLSSAIVTGFAAAKGDYFLVMDADMQHDETVVPQFIEHFKNGSDIVVGSRKSNGGKIENWSAIRKFISWTASILAKVLLTKQCTDPMSGFFGITRDVFYATEHKINPRGFKILLEFLVHGKKYKITEVGYTFKSRQYGESKLSTSVIFDYLIALYDLKFGKIIPRSFIKYSLVGVSGVFVNTLGLWLGNNILNIPQELFISLSFFTSPVVIHDISLLLGIEMSLISNFFINHYWTFRDKNKMSKVFKPFLQFHLVCLFGAIINYAVALYFNSNFGINLYISNIIGIVIATIWNYFMNITFTWKSSHHK